MIRIYPGTIDEYLAGIQRENAEREAQRRNEQWLRDSDTATLIAALEQGKAYGWSHVRMLPIRSELNNRAHDGDQLALPYKMTDEH